MTKISTIFRNKCKLKLTAASISFLLVFLFLLYSINGIVVLGQENSLTEESLEIKIIKDQMQQMKTRIWRIEKRAWKKPDNINVRKELIRLRKSLFKMLDNCLERLEVQLKNKQDSIVTIEEKIELLEEKEECTRKLKDDFVQFSKGKVEQLEELRKKLLVNPQDFKEYMQIMSDLEMFEIGNKLMGMGLEDASVGATTTMKIRRSIDEEIERCKKNEKIEVKTYDEEIQKLKRDIKQTKMKYIALLKTETTEIEGMLQKKKSDVNLNREIIILRKKYFQVINECIQQIEDELKVRPNDETLAAELKELKEQKAKIE